ncbi:MAG: hypothetical protein K6T59_10125 [Bryobacteraceae bacterium]|jgi:hypothetical protein|nr:hypothetical protein [Bryobacteraceae bacterium]
MPAALELPVTQSPAAPGLGPQGPFPAVPLSDVLERRWLHYAFLTRDCEFGMVANAAWLGVGSGQPERPFSTCILLVHRRNCGWAASQFNARAAEPLWSCFRQPYGLHEPRPLVLRAASGDPGVELRLARSSRPCTNQCAGFAGDHFFRWQSEPGILAQGNWTFRGRTWTDQQAVGYHERVRGRWGWPELGGWVFGFANDTAATTEAAPAHALVFTLIQPDSPPGAATASVMVWRSGRFVRHFPRRRVSVAVRGLLDRNRVAQVPGLANLLGVAPMAPVPSRLAVCAAMGGDFVALDFACESAARIVIPNETGLAPFSVHEVIGPAEVEGRISGRPFRFATFGIVEFAGGARAG